MKELKELRTIKLKDEFVALTMQRIVKMKNLATYYALSRTGRIFGRYQFNPFYVRKVVHKKLYVRR